MQDEAMHTHYICTVKREASLKALFMVKDDELTFQKATELAQETEEASDKSFKETVHEPSASSTTIVLKMYTHAQASRVKWSVLVSIYICICYSTGRSDIQDIFHEL